MNIDEVLLTEDEMEKAIGGEFVDDTLMILDFQSACKAAQLKLLEWLRVECKEHDFYMVINNEIHQSTNRYSCPECMAELESKLKEG